MNYTFMPSLEHMAVVKMAVMLWNNEDNRTLLMKNYSTKDERKQQGVWLDVENKIIEKVPKLLLPKLLENKLLDIIKPIGVELLKWSIFHENFLDSDRKLVRGSLNKLRWTPQGTVDRKKTAEILINDENLKIPIRYKLACIYCLEHDIPKLWNKMSKNSQRFFYCEDPQAIRQHALVVFWTYSIKGQVTKVMDMILKRHFDTNQPYQIFLRFQNYSYQQFLFESAVKTSKSATEYFLKKLPCGKKEELLRRTASRLGCSCKVRDHSYHCNGEVLLFLLSQMDSRLQTEVSDNHVVLQCLLDWPWHRFFEETANRSQLGSYKIFLSINVLSRIADKVVNGYRDWNYQKLFGEYWQKKLHNEVGFCICLDIESTVNRTEGPLLLKLLMVDDKEIVEMILNEATVSQKENIIFSDKGMKICESLVIADKWDSLELFIQKCISHKSKMMKFKEEFRKRIVSCRTERKLEEENDMWNKFFKFVDNLALEIIRKRSKGEEDSSPAKMFCCGKTLCKYPNPRGLNMRRQRN